MDTLGIDLNPPELNLSEDDEIPRVNCTYVTPDSFKTEATDSFYGSFSLLSFNIRSCRRNFASFVTFLCGLMFKFSVLVLVETWLTEGSDCAFDISGYKQVNLYRDNFGGGIKIFYDDMLNIEIDRNLTFVNDIMEVITFVLIGANFRYLICCVYRSTAANAVLFNEMFFSRVINRFPLHEKVIVTGDFNLNLYNPLKLTYIDVFLTSMLGHGYFPAITLPAKFNENNQITPFSLIDQIWTNFKTGTNHESGILLFSLTDHFPIFYIFKDNCNTIVRTFQSRLINFDTIQTFVRNVSNSCFRQVFLTQNPEVAFNEFLCKLMECYNSAFPIKRKRVKKNKVNAPWVTPELKRCIRKKYRLFNLMRRGLISRRQFNVYKNALNWVTNKMKIRYHMNEFENCKRDSKKTWSNINTLLGRGEREPVRTVVTEDGSVIEGPQIANSFNNYFINIVSRLTRGFPQGIDFNCFEGIRRIDQTCFLAPTDESEVRAILRSMPNKGNSLSDIKPSILLSVVDTVASLIAYLYNLCIEVGVYPIILKIGRVIPVFKSGDKKSMGNYRPITTLTTINKIFEILTHSRMSKFIDRFQVLSNLQFGFRKASSTTAAIFKFVSDILPTFNEKSYTIALFLDLKKAFDTVDRDILIHKLSIKGFRGVVNSFLSSYLSNREQYTCVENHTSDTGTINSGVPQGSVLGPLLFNIFIDDIVNINIAKKVLFADDAVFYINEKSLELCIRKVNMLIEELSSWLRNNKLIPNVAKTKLMLFTPRPIDELPDVFFSGVKLEWVTSIKYLGIIIDNKLSFTPQSTQVYHRLSKMQGIFYSLSSLVPQSTLITLYYSLVYPIIIQNIIIWGGIPEANLRNIKTTLNKILRNILRVEYDENNIPLISTSEMYKTLKFLKFEDVYRYFLLKFIHDVFYRQTEFFNEYFAPLLPSHSYGTRGVRINLPSVRLEIGKQSTLFQTCKLVNELPTELLEPQADGTLKKKYKSMVISQY